MPAVGASLAINRRYRQKLFGIEACTSDKGAIDIVDSKQLRGIGRFYRAAIENPRRFASIAKTCGELLADETMHVFDIFGRWRQPRADCPHWLIGNDEISSSVGFIARPTAAAPAL